LAAAVAVALAATLAPAAAQAQGTTEVTFAVGALLGDDINLGFEIIDEARAKFENSPIYGGRVGYYTYPLGVEASFMYSPSGVRVVPVQLTPDSVGLFYAEVNALLLIIPGPVQPFVTGGVGLHHIKFTYDIGQLSESAFGWNWGGGLKLNLGPVVVRAEARDHVTRFESGDVLALLGVSNTFHNWEASLGIGVAF